MVTNHVAYNIVVLGANKSGEQLLDEIQAAAERRTGAGGVTFVVRPG